MEYAELPKHFEVLAGSCVEGLTQSVDCWNVKVDLPALYSLGAETYACGDKLCSRGFRQDRISKGIKVLRLRANHKHLKQWQEPYWVEISDKSSFPVKQQYISSILTVGYKYDTFTDS